MQETNVYTKEKWIAGDDFEVGLLLVAIVFINLFVRPHRGSGRKIHEGQMIHMSVRSTVKDYIPKARPFGDDPSFWEMLRSKDKDSAMANVWLELDMYERSKVAVKKLVSEGSDTALEPLIMSGKLSHP